MTEAFDLENSSCLEIWLNAAEDKYYLELVPYQNKDTIENLRKQKCGQLGCYYLNIEYESFKEPFIAEVKEKFPDADLIPNQTTTFYTLPNKIPYKEFCEELKTFTCNLIHKYHETRKSLR